MNKLLLVALCFLAISKLSSSHPLKSHQVESEVHLLKNSPNHPHPHNDDVVQKNSDVEDEDEYIFEEDEDDEYIDEEDFEDDEDDVEEYEEEEEFEDDDEYMEEEYIDEEDLEDEDDEESYYDGEYDGDYEEYEEEEEFPGQAKVNSVEEYMKYFVVNPELAEDSN